MHITLLMFWRWCTWENGRCRKTKQNSPCCYSDTLLCIDGNNNLKTYLHPIEKYVDRKIVSNHCRKLCRCCCILLIVDRIYYFRIRLIKHWYFFNFSKSSHLFLKWQLCTWGGWRSSGTKHCTWVRNCHWLEASLSIKNNNWIFR